jgi:hypothetical protein
MGMLPLMIVRIHARVHASRTADMDADHHIAVFDAYRLRKLEHSAAGRCHVLSS